MGFLFQSTLPAALLHAKGMKRKMTRSIKMPKSNSRMPGANGSQMRSSLYHQLEQCYPGGEQGSLPSREAAATARTWSSKELARFFSTYVTVI